MARAALFRCTTLTRRRIISANRLRNEVVLHLLSVADQAVVTGAQFLTTIAIARWASPGDLGAYSLGYLLLGFGIAIQDSLISLPYMIQLHSPIGTPAEHAGSVLMQSCLLSVLAAIGLSAATLALFAIGATPVLAAATLALAVLAPFRLLREFGRQFAFAHLRMAQALMLDGAVAAIQLGAVGCLAVTGRLSAVTAMLALGVAYTPVSLLGMWLARSEFAVRLDRVCAITRQSWKLGRWLFGGQITIWMQLSAANWALTLIVGATATGVYAACMSVAGFANPLVFSFCNTLTPKAVKALREGGVAGLRRHAVQSALLLGAGMAAFCVLMGFTGSSVMGLLYHGKEYGGQQHTLTVLTLALLASYVGIPASNALASMERPRAIVLVGSVGVAVTIALVSGLTVRWGLMGAAYGFLGGNIAGTLGRWIALSSAVGRREAWALTANKDPNVKLVIQVVEQITQDSDGSRWAIERLGEASQAFTYTVRRQDWQPILGDHRTLVVKLYKPELGRNAEAVNEQYDALSRLHAAIHGRVANGWRISAPEPLYVCRVPLALIMTLVPGRTLTSCFETGDNMTPETLDSVARAIVAAMDARWSLGKHHGDLTCDNILCDVLTRDLSLIDPAAFTSHSAADGGSESRDPRARDLLTILAYVGLIGNQSARLRRRAFVECVLRAILDTSGPPENKEALLEELAAYARQHLQGSGPSWAPRPVLGPLLCPIILRRIDAMLARLRAELRGSSSRPWSSADFATPPLRGVQHGGRLAG